MSRVRSIVVCGVLLSASAIPQTARRTADGKPDLNGIWQALNTAAWDIQDHTGQLGVPPGQGVVEGNEIPYQPWAAAKKKENFASRGHRRSDRSQLLHAGRAARHLHALSVRDRADSQDRSRSLYEFAHALRTIPMDGSPHPDGLPDTWMGDSRGRWEGDTLVVDVKNFNDQTWFDHAGNFHSDALHVVERYTLADPDHILYEATIEDPKVFTRPWKMSMPLYRRVDKNAKILEYECVFYLQEERFKNAPFK